MKIIIPQIRDKTNPPTTAESLEEEFKNKEKEIQKRKNKK